MSEKKIKTRLQNKHDFESNWIIAGVNGFTPLAGELIIYDKEVDAEGNILAGALPADRTFAYKIARYKIGDGFTNVTDLPFNNNLGLDNGQEFGSIQQTEAQAISNGAVAFGVDTFAGLKGFEIISHDDANKAYTLSSALPGVIAVGTTFSAQIKNNFYNHGKLTYISNDRCTIKVDNYINVDEMQTAAGAGVEIVKNLWFVDYPNAGTIDIGKYAFTTGSGSKAIQEYTFSTGRDNKSIGKYSTTLGRDNEAYYAAFAAGQNNKALNERAYTLGNKNTVTGLNGGALGYNNTTSGTNAIALGDSLKATGDYQTIVGRANVEDPDAMFVVGTGTFNSKARNNAFVVKKDNTVEANFVPTKDSHLTNKKYVDTKFAAVPKYDLTQYYTKTQSDSKFLVETDLDEYYTKSEVDEKTATYTTDARELRSKQVPINAQPIVRISSISGNEYSCNNLLRYPPYYNTTKTSNGITYTDNGDGTITLNGTATADSSFSLFALNSNFTLPAGTYTLSGAPGDVGWNTYTIVINAKNAAGTSILSSGAISGTNNAKYTFTLTQDAAQCQIYIKVKSGIKLDNITVSPMLNDGDEALPFEAYFTGIQNTYLIKIISTDADGNPVAIEEVPNEVIALEDFGKAGFIMNLDDQTYCSPGQEARPLPAKFGPFFKVVPGGALKFVTTENTKVPSVVNYTTDENHANLWKELNELDYHQHTVSYTPTGTIASTEVTPAGTVGSTSTTPSGNNSNTSITPSGTVTVTTSNPGSGQTATYTPAGNVSSTFKGESTEHQHTFNGTASSHSHSFSGTTGVVSTSYTPAGTVSQPAFSGTAVTSDGPSGANEASDGTAVVASRSHKHKVTVTGTVSQPEFTGTPTTSGVPSNSITTVSSITSRGTLPSHSYTAPSLTSSISNKCMTLTFNAGNHTFTNGSLLTYTDISVPNANHTHSFTAAGTVSQPTFTSNTVHSEAPDTTITNASATVASYNHVHNVTAAGTVSQPTFTGTNAIISANYTPAGNIEETSITPSGAITKTNITPEGTVTSSFTGAGRMITASFSGIAAEHTHTFTGTAASHNHTFTGSPSSHQHAFTGDTSTFKTSIPK